MARSTGKAKQMIDDWKGENYAHGIGVLGRTGGYAARFGASALMVVADLEQDWVEPVRREVEASLAKAGVTSTAVLGAGPNAPREDLYRIANEISKNRPDSVVAVGGGSTIDAAKAASALAAYSVGEVMEHLDASEAEASGIEPYFGMGNVTKISEALGRKPVPVVAVETVSSSGAHLTKYSNITDPLTGQKKLIIDMAVVPPCAVFDFGVTTNSPKSLTLDGGLDGIAHMWEVFMGASGKDYFDRVEEIAVEGISLIVEYLPRAVEKPADTGARTALGYGTDLGGYAIMVGGTNGGHLGSFSLVDVLSHGRACALLNPYYTVLFSPAIQKQLKAVGAVFRDAGYMEADPASLEGRDLGEAVARAMISFSKSIGFPATLEEAGATTAHIDRMIEAAKNPQLESKLKNMPTPMDPSKGDVDAYMRPVLEAALTGDFSKIRMIGG